MLDKNNLQFGDTIEYVGNPSLSFNGFYDITTLSSFTANCSDDEKDNLIIVAFSDCGLPFIFSVLNLNADDWRLVDNYVELY